MANRIKGITIELNGDATGLQDALKGVNGSLGNTQKALSDVTKLLKLDPKNTALVEQKQKLLADAVEQTREKLDALESAQEQVQQAFDKGELGEDKYLAFRRELEATGVSWASTRLTCPAWRPSRSGWGATPSAWRSSLPPRGNRWMTMPMCWAAGSPAPSKAGMPARISCRVLLARWHARLPVAKGTSERWRMRWTP